MLILFLDQCIHITLSLHLLIHVGHTKLIFRSTDFSHNFTGQLVKNRVKIKGNAKNLGVVFLPTVRSEVQNVFVMEEAQLPAAITVILLFCTTKTLPVNAGT